MDDGFWSESVITSCLYYTMLIDESDTKIGNTICIQSRSIFITTSVRELLLIIV